MTPWAKAAVQGAACGLVFGMVLLAGGRLWQPQLASAQARRVPPNVGRAERFEVVDAAGKIRAVLGESGFGRLALILYDAAGEERAALEVVRNGSPSVTLWDAAAKGMAAASLFVDPGKPGVSFTGGYGKGSAELVVNPDGSSSLGLSDLAQGQARAAMDLATDGSPSLELVDRKGTSRAKLGAISPTTSKIKGGMMRPESSLVLFDKDGKVTWKAP